MKKRILSLVMALVLAVGLLPVGAMAAGSEVIGSVTFSIETKTINGDCIVEPMEEELYSDDTVYTILTRVAQEKDLTVSGADTGYVTQIENFSANGYGDQSGWMVAVNNDHTSWPLPELKDGDSIRFCYTYLTYGYDIDLIDLVDELTDKHTLAVAYEGENTDAVASAMAEADNKLTEIRNYKSNQAYLNAVNIYGAGSETSEIEYLIRKLDTALNGGNYIPAASAEITLTNSDGTPATEFFAGRTYQAHITFTPETPTEQGSGWQLLTGMGVNAEIAADGTLTIQELTDESYGLHMVTIQYWHPDADNGCYTKAITVKELPQEEEPTALERANTLMENIAASYVDNSSQWVVMDMAAYEKLMPDSVSKTSAASKQAYINAAIASVNGDDVDPNTYSKAVLSLTAIGVDPTQLYPVNSNTPTDCTKQLRAMTISNHYSAPWVLLANLQGSLKLDDTQIDALIELLKTNQMDSGMFGYEWNGQAYTDLDTTGTAIAALAPLYTSKKDAKEIIDKAITGLSMAQDSTTGSFGSSNSDAMVIIGLASVGIDPSSDSRFVKNGNSLLDGLLSFGLANNNGFGYIYNTSFDALATEQGFRALIAAYQVMSTGQAYNVYDFSANEVVPGRATGAGAVTPPTTPPETNKDITVTVTVKADTGYWLQNKSVTVDEGSTAYHAFVKALDGSGITQVGAENGYVESMTKNGTTLAEFTKGEASGWLYKVNETLPDVGLTDYTISDGDSIVWYYTEDWTKDPQAGSGSSPLPETAMDKVEALIDKIGTVTVDSGQAIQAAREAYDKLTDAQKKLVENYDVLTKAEAAYAALTSALPFTDIADHWALEAIQYVYEKDLMNGVSDTAFAPNKTLNRAMLATILYRMEGSPAVTTANPYSDVAADTWYADAVIWASENGIVNGYGNGRFGPTDNITREQLAAMLLRYSDYKEQDTDARNHLTSYTDAGTVSAWALESVQWANAEGLVTGRTETTIVPKGSTTRAEAATILMRYLENAAG